METIWHRRACRYVQPRSIQASRQCAPKDCGLSCSAGAHRAERSPSAGLLPETNAAIPAPPGDAAVLVSRAPGTVRQAVIAVQSSRHQRWPRRGIGEAGAPLRETGHTVCLDCGRDHRGLPAVFRRRCNSRSPSTTRRSDLQNRFLKPLQQSFGLTKLHTKILGSNILKRATDMPHIVHQHFTVFKHRLNKNPNIHDAPRLVLKTSTYHTNHQLLPTPVIVRSGLASRWKASENSTAKAAHRSRPEKTSANPSTTRP